MGSDARIDQLEGHSPEGSIQVQDHGQLCSNVI